MSEFIRYLVLSTSVVNRSTAKEDAPMPAALSFIIDRWTASIHDRQAVRASFPSWVNLWFQLWWLWVVPPYSPSHLRRIYGSPRISWKGLEHDCAWI
jgi:hypothetical protein